MKKLLSMLLVLAMVLSVIPAAVGAEDASSVTIVYTNDVHTYINNTKTNDDKSVTPLLTYASVAALRQELADAGENVILVDAGDHSQGTVYGAYDEGRSVIQLMNASGYQVATLGNHEFDYGMFRAFGIMEEARFQYVSCNFVYLPDDNLPLAPYYVIEQNGIRVAFIGITTPDTIESSSPAYFQDSDGNYIYEILGGSDGSELYAAVQSAIDAAKQEADYVIGLGHLGVDESSKPYTSREVIANTTGLDAFIDGHSHTTIPGEIVADASGASVVLTQTGCYLNAIGVMRIGADGITTELITEYEGRDPEVAALTEEVAAAVQEKLGSRIAVSDGKLTVNNEDDSVRLVRRAETNLGDLAADAVYYYFNEVSGISCDIAITNGGGVRTSLEAGDLTYLDAKAVHPFGNVICLQGLTGQQVLDMLEWSCSQLGLTAEDGTPAQFGGFLQVAGLRFTVDTSISCTIGTDEKGLYASAPTGEYRVKDVAVYDRASGSYVPLDPAAVYNVGGVNYILRNSGNGYTMFSDDQLVVDYVAEDYLALAAYMAAFAAGEDGVPHINTAGSPLAAYAGYLLNYEDLAGAGRITIQ